MKQKKLLNVRQYINKPSQKFFILTSLVLLSGCSTIYEADRVDEAEFSNEPRVGFVRPDKYSFAIFGSRSIGEHVEITYERLTENEAGFPQVELGLRNKGGQNFWDRKAQGINLSIKTDFYSSPINSKGPTGSPVYQTNWRPLRIVRGGTEHYQAICPVKGARYYQIRISEHLK